MLDRTEFIQAMRGVASSVTVVTTKGLDGFHGATVTAFCSVSADPPTVLICLKSDSRIAKLISENSGFCVNVLPSTSQYIADRFAGRHDADISDRFDGIDCNLESAVAPTIDGSTAFACKLKQTIDSGSHRVLIGKVVKLIDGISEPITWCHGDYHRIVPTSPLSYLYPTTE